MSSWLPDLLGTLRNTFRVGPKTAPVTLDASSVTAARTAAFQDKSGTIAYLDDVVHYAPLHNGDPLAPEIIYDDYGRMIMGQVFYGDGAAAGVGSIATVYTRSVSWVKDNVNPIVASETIAVYIRAHMSGTISRWTLYGDVAGSAVVSVWRDTYANYPPVIGDTITGGNDPTVTAALTATDNVLTGWSTTVQAGDFIGVLLASASTFKQLTFQIEITSTLT